MTTYISEEGINEQIKNAVVVYRKDILVVPDNHLFPINDNGEYAAFVDNTIIITNNDFQELTRINTGPNNPRVMFSLIQSIQYLYPNRNTPPIYKRQLHNDPAYIKYHSKTKDFIKKRKIHDHNEYFYNTLDSPTTPIDNDINNLNINNIFDDEEFNDVIDFLTNEDII